MRGALLAALLAPVRAATAGCTGAGLIAGSCYSGSQLARRTSGLAVPGHHEHNCTVVVRVDGGQLEGRRGRMTLRPAGDCELDGIGGLRECAKDGSFTQQGQDIHFDCSMQGGPHWVEFNVTRYCSDSDTLLVKVSATNAYSFNAKWSLILHRCPDDVLGHKATAKLTGGHEHGHGHLSVVDQWGAGDAKDAVPGLPMRIPGALPAAAAAAVLLGACAAGARRCAGRSRGAALLAAE